jgi:hypothetical protein
MWAFAGGAWDKNLLVAIAAPNTNAIRREYLTSDSYCRITAVHACTPIYNANFLQCGDARNWDVFIVVA